MRSLRLALFLEYPPSFFASLPEFPLPQLHLLFPLSPLSLPLLPGVFALLLHLLFVIPLLPSPTGSGIQNGHDFVRRRVDKHGQLRTPPSILVRVALQLAAHPVDILLRRGRGQPED